MTMSQFCFDMTYMWFKNAPGSTWELQAGRQRLAIWQMQDDDAKDWEAVIKCVRPVEMIYTLEPLDRALQELEGECDNITKRLRQLGTTANPTGGVSVTTLFLCPGYELYCRAANELEKKLFNIRFRSMAEQLPSRIDLMQRIRNRFT